MTEKEMENFLKTVQGAYPSNGNFNEVEALEWALCNVPKVNHDTWFGEIHSHYTVGGVFYANDRESRWFPGASVEEVADLLAREMY